MTRTRTCAFLRQEGDSTKQLQAFSAADMKLKILANGSRPFRTCIETPAVVSRISSLAAIVTNESRYITSLMTTQALPVVVLLCIMRDPLAMIGSLPQIFSTVSMT
jgi:hypothetical protein